MEEQKTKKDYLLPASIILAAILISASFVYSTGKKVETDNNASPGTQVIQKSPENVKPISEDDHILGNFGAPVKVITFTDFECPYCKNFHITIKQTLEKYDGQIAWTYRHSPIDQLHSKARKEAEASECAAEQGGDEKFWAYVDRLFELTPSNNGLDLTLLPKIAKDVGLDTAKFETCLASGKYAEKIEAQRQNAENSCNDPTYGCGTPYSIVIGPKGGKVVIPGAYPFESTDARIPTVPQFIEEAMKK